MSANGDSPIAIGTRQALAAIAAGRPEALGALCGPGRPGAAGELDRHTVALARLAVLVALDGPPAAYAWEVHAATELGVGAEELLELLRVIAPQVGTARVTAAAPEIMLALGLSLPQTLEHPEGEEAG